MKQIQQAGEAVLAELEKAVLGKKTQLRLVLTCLLADGHLLLEDVPGTAKTVLAKALARALGSDFARLQGTPDLLPGDVTGSSIYHPGTGTFTFQPGPVFTQVLLADELNRATPRAQSALLECMAERQVSTEGTTHRLERPFFVVATQNPIEQEGTFPLPEAQLDRFTMRLSLGYPSLDAEVALLAAGRTRDPLADVQAVLDGPRLAALQDAVRDVHVAPPVAEYLVRLVQATRRDKGLVLGASPRASKALQRAAQAFAGLNGRDHVLPDDLKFLLPSVLFHRLILGPEARLAGRTVREVVDGAIARIPAPAVR